MMTNHSRPGEGRDEVARQTAPTYLYRQLEPLRRDTDKNISINANSKQHQSIMTASNRTSTAASRQPTKASAYTRTQRLKQNNRHARTTQTPTDAPEKNIFPFPNATDQMEEHPLTSKDDGQPSRHQRLVEAAAAALRHALARMLQLHKVVRGYHAIRPRLVAAEHSNTHNDQETRKGGSKGSALTV